MSKRRYAAKTALVDGAWVGESEFDRWGIWDQQECRFVDWAETRAEARRVAKWLNERYAAA